MYGSPLARVPEIVSPLISAWRIALFSTSVRNCEYGISGFEPGRALKLENTASSTTAMTTQRMMFLVKSFKSGSSGARGRPFKPTLQDTPAARQQVHLGAARARRRRLLHADCLELATH